MGGEGASSQPGLISRATPAQLRPPQPSKVPMMTTSPRMQSSSPVARLGWVYSLSDRGLETVAGALPHPIYATPAMGLGREKARQTNRRALIR